MKCRERTLSHSKTTKTRAVSTGAREAPGRARGTSREKAEQLPPCNITTPGPSGAAHWETDMRHTNASTTDTT